MGTNGVQEPRPAAAVIAARDSARGVEVLVLQRSSVHRFLPGYVVFPGGAVDPEDVDQAQAWFGDRAEASRACAVRELAEEVGLVLTADGLREAGEGGFALVEAALPRVDQLRQISHWIAPEEVPVRFDARFYAVDAPEGLRPRVDGEEAQRAWWARPSEILADFVAGRCDLYWPTMKTFKGLARCDTAAEVFSLDLLQVDFDEPDDPQPARAPAPEVGGP